LINMGKRRRRWRRLSIFVSSKGRRGPAGGKRKF